MARKWTLNECHRQLSTIPKNPRWSWSGRSADGSKVSVQLWQDGFSDGGKTYATGPVTKDMPWVGTPGHNELVDNLKWAKDHCGGEVRVIIAIAGDKDAHPRKAASFFPQEKLTMKVEYLDEQTGEFTLSRAN